MVNGAGDGLPGHHEIQAMDALIHYKKI